MTDYATIAQQFVQFYYKTFDENRTALASLYREASMLTFENDAIGGASRILDKLTNIPLGHIKHEVATLDAQPSGPDGIIVMVTGALLVDEEQKPMSYTQTFQLKQEGNTYFVHNDIFRLIYSATS